MYIETAPLIYYVEENLAYLPRMDAIIELAENTPIGMVGSVITLTEVLMHPKQTGHTQLEQEYRVILQNSPGFRLLPVTATIADEAADLRARYRLRTSDALLPWCQAVMRS